MTDMTNCETVGNQTQSQDTTLMKATKPKTFFLIFFKLSMVCWRGDAQLVLILSVLLPATLLFRFNLTALITPIY